MTIDYQKILQVFLIGTIFSPPPSLPLPLPPSLPSSLLSPSLSRMRFITQVLFPRTVTKINNVRFNEPLLSNVNRLNERGICLSCSFNHDRGHEKAANTNLMDCMSLIGYQ